MMMGAPVFALTGYAVASHVIPRGFAYRCLEWLGRRCAIEVCCNNSGEAQRAGRRTHGQVCEGFLRDTSLKRLQQRRNRYSLFFAKLFFHPKKKRSEGDVDVSGDAGGGSHDLETDGVPIVSVPGT